MIKNKEALIMHLLQCLAVLLLTLLLAKAAFSQNAVYTAASAGQPEVSESSLGTQEDAITESSSDQSTEHESILDPYIEKQISSKVLAMQALHTGVINKEFADSEDADNVDPDSRDLYTTDSEDRDSDAGNPDAGNPDSGNPDLGNPDSGNPDFGNPDAGNPDFGNPDSGNPDSGNPDSGNPGSGNPDSGNPGSRNPDSGNSVAGNSDAGNSYFSGSDSRDSDSGYSNAGNSNFSGFDSKGSGNSNSWSSDFRDSGSGSSDSEDLDTGVSGVRDSNSRSSGTSDSDTADSDPKNSVTAKINTSESHKSMSDAQDKDQVSGYSSTSPQTDYTKIKIKDTDKSYQASSAEKSADDIINSTETEWSSPLSEYSIVKKDFIPLAFEDDSEKKQLLYEFDLRIGEEAGLLPLYIHEIPAASLSWEEFEASISSMIDSFTGDWSFYLKNLKTKKVISINENPMESASLIKLYIMGTIYQHIEDGSLEKTDTITRLLEDMITVSDNESSNELVRSLSPTRDHKEGMKMVNDFIKANGFHNTKQVNGLADPSLRVVDAKNQTSTADCGKLLEKIYKGNLVSHLASRSMENLLLNQKITYKIPAGLPNGVVSANKTGEVSDSENDAAIVYSGACDYILCIMSSDQTNTNLAVDQINDLSSLVYEYFNG